MVTLLQKTSLLETSYDEEDSSYFLETIQKDYSISYSSKDYSIDTISESINTFILLHATISLPNKGYGKFWSAKPIGSFRYILNADGSCGLCSTIKPPSGYLVQGAYWSNGFYYLVSHLDFLIEANLFIDLATKEQYNYP
jgi:hypothetical protein